MRYKEVSVVYWQGGAGRKLYYRKPAFLLTTDLKDSVKQLLQIYFDRWQIEVNHRDEKDTLGVGQVQLWNVEAVPKQPVLAVAAYSALLLASLIAFGAERGAAYKPAQMAAESLSAFLPGSDHPVTQGNGLTARPTERIRGQNHGKTARSRCRRLKLRGPAFQRVQPA